MNAVYIYGTDYKLRWASMIQQFNTWDTLVDF